jgi:hypothetical protein
MKRIYILSSAIIFVLATAGALAQEISGAGLGFTVTNGKGRSQYVELGIRQGASTGLDPQFGESELPPLPPSQIFDIRFLDTPGKSQLGNGSLNDYRPIQSTTSPFSATYTLGFQGGEGVSTVNIAWLTPYPGRISKVTIDGNDMTGKNEYNTQFGQGQSTIEVTYNFLPLTFQVLPTSLSFTAGDRDPLPSKVLTVTPQGDVSASWQIVASDPWLSVSPTTGNGAMDVTVSINTNQIPTGVYTSSLLVRSPQEPGGVDVPVTLTFTVGTDAVRAANGMSLSANYPNPFSTATSIVFDLGPNPSNAGGKSLKVYDVAGRLVADFSTRIAAKSGTQIVSFDGSGLTAGFYRYTLTSGGHELSRTMTLIK